MHPREPDVIVDELLDHPAAFAGMVKHLREEQFPSPPDGSPVARPPTPVHAVPPEAQAFVSAFPRATRRKIEALCRKAKRQGRTVRIYRDGRCEIVAKPAAPRAFGGSRQFGMTVRGLGKSALGTGLQATDQPQVAAAPAAEPQPGPAQPQARRFEPKPTGPVDLVAQAKARLALIDKELERLTELQRERRKLAAMVAAADNTADVTGEVES